MHRHVPSYLTAGGPATDFLQTFHEDRNFYGTIVQIAREDRRNKTVYNFCFDEFQQGNNTIRVSCTNIFILSKEEDEPNFDHVKDTNEEDDLRLVTTDSCELLECYSDESVNDGAQ